MRADYTVTVWHFDENLDIPERKILKNVAASRAECISKNGIKQRGFFRNDSLRVRIFTREDVGIKPGDYLCMGEFVDTKPIKELCHKVVEVRDNRQGSRHHWHIICGG